MLPREYGIVPLISVEDKLLHQTKKQRNQFLKLAYGRGNGSFNGVFIQSQRFKSIQFEYFLRYLTIQSKVAKIQNCYSISKASNPRIIPRTAVHTFEIV